MTSTVLEGVLYGHGHMGQLHANKLKARADVNLTIIDPVKGFPHHPPERVDFAVIATPTSSHTEVAIPLLESGIPCLVEKPLAKTIEGAELLATHPHLSVGHIERFNPVFNGIDTQKVEYIEAERLSILDDRSRDIDVIADLMIHDIDLLLQHMPGRITDIRAKGVGLVNDLPDLVNARIEIETQYGQKGVANLTASRVSSVSLRSWRLFAPRKYWSLDLKHRIGKRIEWPNSSEALSVADVDPLAAEHDAFLGAVRGQNSFPCPGGEAVNCLHVAERIRQCLL